MARAAIGLSAGGEAVGRPILYLTPLFGNVIRYLGRNEVSTGDESSRSYAILRFAARTAFRRPPLSLPSGRQSSRLQDFGECAGGKAQYNSKGPVQFQKAQYNSSYLEWLQYLEWPSR
jgi:hypothetical protein